jgi:hypothetical protein
VEKLTIEITLPHVAGLTEFDLELMKATFLALMSLRRECGKEWKNILQELEEDGWKVAWRLSWQAEARRGRDVEEAAASTLDEAFDRLRQLTRLDSPILCP